MASVQSDDDDGINSINVTPLVDIVLVLLIIFMVTANFIVHESIEIDLPRAANSKDQTVRGPIMVTVDRDAKLYFDGQPVDAAELLSKMRAAATQDNSIRAIISADQSLNYGKVMAIIDVVRASGISKFALNIQKEAVAP